MKPRSRTEEAMIAEYTRLLALVGELEQSIRDRQSAACEAIRKEHEPVLVELKQLLEAQGELLREEQLRIDTEVAASVKDERIGRKVVQWDIAGFGRGSWYKTGKLGIVEVIGPRQGKVKFRYYYRATAGNLCVRELLASGKPGRWATVFVAGLSEGLVAQKLPWGWYFEGETPKEAK